MIPIPTDNGSMPAFFLNNQRIACDSERKQMTNPDTKAEKFSKNILITETNILK